MKYYTIIKNERKNPNEFVNKVDCDFCTSYINQVILIPKTTKFICKTCLCELINALDNNMIMSFNK